MRSFYSYIGDAWSSPREGYVGALRQDRLKAWRQESTVQKIERPTRLDRARALGYKAKQGIIVARVMLGVSKGEFYVATAATGFTPNKAPQRFRAKHAD